MARRCSLFLVLSLLVTACGKQSTNGSDGGPSDGGSCSDACSAFSERCAGSQVQKCEKQPDGCEDWGAPADCPTNETCLGQQCVLSCSDECIAGATQCSSGEVQTCAKQSNGCTGWNAATACPDSGTCSGGQCASMCSNQCTVGDMQCSGPEIQTCATQSNGCTDWNPAQACPGTGTCSNNQCSASCTSACTAGATQCSGSQVENCETQSNGCTIWGQAQSCPAGGTCSNGQCASACTNECTAAATQCSGSQVQLCETQSNGCTGWDPAQNCPSGETCSGSQCTSTSCTPGAQQCNGTLLQVCTANSTWATQQVCGQTCDPTMMQCTETVTCTAAAQRCSGDEVEVCNSTGTAWLGVQQCTDTCTAGLCTGNCTAGATQCNGTTPQTCDSAGTGWTAGTACSTVCVSGVCANPTLTINANANQTLDGEQWFDGDVVIENSSVLTSPTGRLIIHANNVTLDATSQIVIAPTGNDPRGTGRPSSPVTCYGEGDYCSTSTSASGGAGGSFGGSGVSIPVSAYCYSEAYGDLSCSGAASTGAVYGIADDEEASGAAGGSCASNAGTLGGGLLVIDAQTITIQGVITANGQGSQGCAGGGSGGGVVLRASQNLAFTGSVSVAPGAGGSSGGGAGGNGVVKLLYGNESTLTGSVVGVKFASFMPPPDVSSTSHPDPTHWYNDGFTVFELAWSQPFTNTAGFYYNLNQTYAYIPTPANSMFLGAESELYQPSALLAGTNDFHIDTVGPFANVGTIEHRFQVNINSTPPTISSSSHPSQSTWYNNTSPYFTWTVPNSNSDVTNFYWVFDSFANTIPTVASNAIPMNLATPQDSEQLLLPNQSNGIQFFHLIAQDTAGYLTQQAASYRVQIGAQPGQGSVSGTVIDKSSSAPLNGVTVTLNRGVLSATSNSNGSYAFANDVFAQEYEIRASLTGYQDSVQMVTVVASQTATVNLIMSH